MGAILTEIINLLVGAISDVATGIGQGLSKLVSNIFLEVSEAGAVTGLSNFGGIIIIFGAISLALGLCYFVVNWLTSWGN